MGLSDADILAMGNAIDNSLFSNLFRGDFKALGSKSVFKNNNSTAIDRSVCDAVMMNRLAIMTNNDRLRMVTIFKKSKLMRKKFDNMRYRNALVKHAIETNKVK